jgi:F420H(2)-dependent quinone reductase
MAVTYRRSHWHHLPNALVRTLLHVGPGSRYTYLLTVRARRSGAPYSTQVIIVEAGGQQWLVASYGDVSRVRSARAAGQVALSRGRHGHMVGIVALTPEEAAPILV